MSQLEIIPCHLDEANAFVRQVHRHHGEVPGAKFSIGVAVSEKVVGVAIVGRPVARMNQDGFTLEILRVATDGTKNACSALYAACWRAARAMGCRKVITYVLASENGVSVKAAGFKCVGQRGGGSWNRPSRPRVDKHPTQAKILWCAEETQLPESDR